MAAYQGARPRGAVFPGGFVLPLPRLDARHRRTVDADEAASPEARRRASRLAVAARIADARPRRVGSILAAIVVLFSVGFVSLSQSVRVAATSYDLVRLQSEHDRMEGMKLDVRSDIDRLASEPAIRKLALDDGLGQLGAPVVIQAR